MRSRRLQRRRSCWHTAASIAQRHARYYAAFYAASALFVLEGRTFTGHSALEAAVHRDLVKAERWSADLGRDYSFCVNVRGVGDYGDEVRVDARQAEETTAAARRILEVVSEAMPNDFPRLTDT